jgi:hypothetical protein
LLNTFFGKPTPSVTEQPLKRQFREKKCGFWLSGGFFPAQKKYPIKNKKRHPGGCLLQSLEMAGSGLGNYRDKRLVGPAFLEENRTVGQRIQGVVFTHPYVPSRMMTGAPLADNNITGNDLLAAEYLNSKSFAFRLPSVLYFTFPFLMCHGV